MKKSKEWIRIKNLMETSFLIKGETGCRLFLTEHPVDVALFHEYSESWVNYFLVVREIVSKLYVINTPHKMIKSCC